MSEQEYDMETEAGRLTAMIDRSGTAAEHVKYAVNTAAAGTSDEEKAYGIGSLVRKLGAELALVGYEVTAVKTPKQPREPKVQSIARGKRTA